MKKITALTSGISRVANALAARKKIVAAVVVLLVIGLFISRSSHKKEETVTSNSRVVTLKSLALLQGDDSPLSLLGTITSISEASLRSETGGKVVRINKKLGDKVAAGEVIAEFDNAGEKAALLQAEGAYDAAKAAKDIAKLNSNQAGSSLTDQKALAVTSLENIYNAIEDAVHAKTDVAFSDPRFDAKLLLSIPDANLTHSLEASRTDLETLMTTHKKSHDELAALSPEGLIPSLAQGEKDGALVKAYLDNLFSAYNKALPNDSVSQASIDAGKAATSLARQSVSGSLSALIASKSTLSGSVTASNVASISYNDTQISTALASVKQAEGAYYGALARLEKTIIRSPLSGTLNSFSLHVGDYVSPFGVVAVVSNNGSLEIVSYVSSEEKDRIYQGAKVKINDSFDGVVTRVAEAIDPTTKKIEVRIAFKNSEEMKQFVNGDSVRVALISEGAKVAATSSPITVPLSALKMSPDGALLFTVDASSTLKALPVKEGQIVGDRVVLEDVEISRDTLIVIDARGLHERDKVIVK